MGQATVTTDLRDLTAEIGTWGDSTFPRDSRAGAIEGALAHLKDEVGELDDMLHMGSMDLVAEELADVFILAFQLAHLLGIDAARAIHDKMAINRTRNWGTPDSRGVVKHVEPGDDPG